MVTQEKYKVSQILRLLVLEDYAELINIIVSDDFNPNVKSDISESPLLLKLINLFGSGCVKIKDKENFQMIFTEIVNHKDFDPNIKDTDGETILTCIARCDKESFNWLVNPILAKGNVDIFAKNFMHKTCMDIAKKKNNTVFMSIINGFLFVKHLGMPRKRSFKKESELNIEISPNKKTFDCKSIITESIEQCYNEEQKKNPSSMYWVLYHFFRGNYQEAENVVTSPHFNPNECDKFEDPALLTLVNHATVYNAKIDEDWYKRIAKYIVDCKTFDPNIINAEGNSPIMVTIGFKSLNWLSELLFNLPNTRIDFINEYGRILHGIAKEADNLVFYQGMIYKKALPCTAKK